MTSYWCDTRMTSYWCDTRMTSYWCDTRMTSYFERYRYNLFFGVCVEMFLQNYKAHQIVRNEMN